MQESLWPTNCPETLYGICLEYCALNLDRVLCNKSADGQLILKSEIYLPPYVCDALITYLHPIGRRHLPLLANPGAVNFRQINLKSVTDLSDAELKHLLAHHPKDLRLSSEQLSEQSLCLISSGSHNLQTLQLVKCDNVFSQRSPRKKPPWKKKCCKDPAKRIGLFHCPKVRYVAFRGIQFSAGEMLSYLLSNLTLITRLDLSDTDINEQHLRAALSELKKLQILSLHSVTLKPDLRDYFEAVAQVKSLRALDLSQDLEDHNAVVYDNVETNMEFLVSELPLLKWLDISGTNLCGWVPDPCISHHPFDKMSQIEPAQQSAIPWLHDRHLDFLGLLNCAHDACHRENLPATQVTGNATEMQVLLSVKTYIEHSELLLLSLNNLFHLFKFSHCRDQRTALAYLLLAMKHYAADKSIQISASAALFFIVKGSSKPFFTTTIKKTIVRTLLKSMEDHLKESLILRNCCLTLCHLRVPHDIMHSYEWMVSTLLKVIESTATPTDEFIQRIAIYLLNALSCQVDYSDKQLVGCLGAFPVILSLISTRVEKGVCDEVLKVAWSMMWNVTDETPSNCQMFIDGDGLNVFLACFNKFKLDGDDLLRNMMGLLGNVAEVQFLRCHLMNPLFISIFRDLLGSTSDGIEVSYNACGVFANIMSDGEDAWTVAAPSRISVLRDMSAAVSRWKLDSKRNINYRSFKPILRLLDCYETREVQYWAVWALCNLTKVYRSKYCLMLVKESGVVMLQDLLTAYQHQRSPLHDDHIAQLALKVISRCERFAVDTDYVTDDEQESDVVNQ